MKLKSIETFTTEFVGFVRVTMADGSQGAVDAGTGHQ